MFKENVTWRNNMSFKKDTEKIVLLKVKDLINIVKFRSKKKLHISIIRHQSSFRVVVPNIAIGFGHQIFCGNKGTNWNFIFPWKKINWHVFQIANGHFSYPIWLMISEKNYAILWRTRFFIMMVHACAKSLSKQGIQKKLFARISNSFSP